MRMKTMIRFVMLGLALTLLLSPLTSVRAAGVVEDQDTIQDPGPGNLDSPAEPNPDVKPPEAKEEEKSEPQTQEGEPQPEPATPSQP